ncbi:MAG: PIN domain-containing protein [Pyrinomonadaceae bacterium]|nr:PIN domain-containing protein [Pyrinomonadaceae bacterium]
MKAIVVDTNVLFAGLRAGSSKIREIFDRQSLSFYAPNFLAVEIFKHKERILHKSKASEDEVYELLQKLFSRVTFISEDSISTANFLQAYRLCGDVDEKDTPFVALALELEAEIWTRDEALKRGLQRNGFDLFFEEYE